jgi:hypothetical protein
MVAAKCLERLNRRMRTLCFCSCAMLSLMLSAAGPAAGADQRYSIAGHGFIQLSVPSSWVDQVDDKSQPPLISFRQSAGAPFIVSITPAPRDPKAAGGDALRAEVGRMAESIRMFAVEQDIKLNDFAGTAGPGSYVFATDASPGPGGFKFMHRGMLEVGKLSVTFTILTNDGQDAVARAALDMLKSAVHVAR